METEALRKVEQLAQKKHMIFKQSRIRYISRSMLASMFIGFGVIVAFKTGNFFTPSILHSLIRWPRLRSELLLFSSHTAAATCLPAIRFIIRLPRSGASSNGPTLSKCG